MRSWARSRTRRRALAGLVLAGFALGLGTAGSVGAQTDEERALISQFGGYELAARGNGLVITYDAVGVFPVPPPVGQAGLPETQSTLTSGPGAYALASLAWPGPLVANIGNALAQDPRCAFPIPAYPVRTEAFYPSAQTEQRTEVLPGASMASLTSATASEGFSQFSGAVVPGFVTVGAINSRSLTEVVDGEVVSRLRVEISGINILAGLVKIESIVTDLVANSNGETAATAGGTTVSGVSVLGLGATIDADGVKLAPAEPASPPVTAPGLDLGGVLTPLVDALNPLLGPLAGLIEELLGVQGTLNELLAQAGIEIRLLDPIETVDGAAATMTGNGLAINLRFDGASVPVLSDLIATVADQLPADPLFPCSPFSAQGLLLLLRETHVTTLALASGFVSAQATPPFEAPSFTPPPVGGTGSVSPPATFGPAPSFGSPAPSLRPVSPAPAPEAAEPAAGEPIALIGQAVPALLVALLIMSAPLWAGASSRLADAVLAPVATGCPEGKDAAPDRGGP